MNDRLRRVQADVDAELSNMQDWPEVNTANPREDLDELLRAFHRSEPPSETFLAALEAVSAAAATSEAPPGRAAASARSARAWRAARSITVEQALNCPASRAQPALVLALRITSDAAGHLLDRPAAVLLTHRPDAVAAVADACGRRRAELFKAIADSSRMTGDFVYPYRPGPAVVTPARRGPEEGQSLADLIAWGRALLDAPVSHR